MTNNKKRKRNSKRAQKRNRAFKMTLSISLLASELIEELPEGPLVHVWRREALFDFHNPRIQNNLLQKEYEECMKSRSIRPLVFTT